MTVASWISQMRTMVRDLNTLTKETWDGDGSTIAFRVSNAPILESSYTVKVGGTLKTEVTDYTLDKDTGLLQFVSAPAAGSDNVSIDYKFVNQRDNDWIEIYNSVIRDIRDDIYEEAVDDSTLTVIADTYDYSLASISTAIIGIHRVETRSSSSEPWSDITKDERSCEFIEDLNKIRIKPYWTSSGDAMRIHYFVAYAEVATTNATVTVDNKYLNMFNHYAAAYYFQRIIPKKLTETAIVTQERTYHPADTVLKVAEWFRQEGDKLLKKVRPPRRPIALITKSRFD